MSAPALHLRWPAERFYWAVLDGAALPRAIGSPRRPLGFLLEAKIPLPIEDVHAVFVPLPGRRFLACALAKETLATEVPAEAVTLSPRTLPPFVEEAVDAERIQLLTGRHAPIAVAKARRRWALQGAALFLVSAATVVLGLERRTAALEARAADRTKSGAALVEAQLGGAASASRAPIDLHLQAELRSLRQSRNAPAPALSSADAPRTLARLLALWPAPLAAETESVQVGGDAVHVRALLPTNEDAQTLASALAPLAGFAPSIPSVHAAADGVRAELAWSREKRGDR